MTKKMNPDIKRRWVEALRSGKYDQTSGVLHMDDGRGNDGYCCLGVLCDIMKDDLEMNWRKCTGLSTFEFDGNTDVLPTSVVQAAGLSSPDPQVPLEDLSQCTLSSINDGDINVELRKDGVLVRSAYDRSAGFDRLADIIEKFF